MKYRMKIAALPAPTMAPPTAPTIARLLALLALFAMAALPLGAQAHAHLQHTVPADGSVVHGAPAAFSLSFSEAAHLTALSVQKQGDAVSLKIAPLPREVGQDFKVTAPMLTPGTYTLRYRVVAADDGHVSAGLITFSIAAKAP
jgi:methionine-rich copper-binding protein CopC